MSYSSLSKALARVRVASKESPIAILKTNNTGKFETLFAATESGRRYIAEHNDRLIGIYHKKNVDTKTLKRELQNV